MTDRVEFWLPFIPLSLKNTPHRFTTANAERKRHLQGQRDTITVLAIAARGKRAGFGTNNVAVHVDEFPLENCVHVRVMDLGPAGCSGPTGRKRDLGNIDALIHDAMQGILYKDDNQLVGISSRRHLCLSTARNPELTTHWESRTLDALQILYRAIVEMEPALVESREMANAHQVLEARGVLPC